MKTTDLKIFALEYINLQDNISKSDKLELMGFVSEASREQVMSMMFTGKMRTLEEGEAKFVSELFEISNVGGFLSEAFALTEAPSLEDILAYDNPASAALRRSIGNVLKVAYKGNKAAIQKAMQPENVEALKKVLKTAVDGNVKGAKAVADTISKTTSDTIQGLKTVGHGFSQAAMDVAHGASKVATAAQGKGSLMGKSAFSQAAHGHSAIGDLSPIKALASKWASFKVPNVKDIPSWLGGGVTGKGDSAVQWGSNYNHAIDALNKGVPIAAAVVAALVIMLSRKAYKAYLTKAARACKGTKGADKDACIRKFKIDASKAQIDILNKSKSACKSAKNPDKCIAQINQQIHKTQITAKKLMTKKNIR